MKSHLLKANKISFSHQLKTHTQTKPKSAKTSTFLDNSSIHDPIADKLPYKKNHNISQHNKQNQLKNIESKQKNQLKNIEPKQKSQLKSITEIREKKQSQSRLRKPSQLYIAEKINKLNKVYRNQSMYINRDGHQNQTDSSSRLSNNRNSFVNQNIYINPNSSKEPNLSIKQKEAILYPKESILCMKQNALKNKKVSKHQLQNSQSKDILQNIQIKPQQTCRKIKRTKLSWLFLAHTFYASNHQLTVRQNSKKYFTNQNIPTLLHLVHYLKNYQKIYHLDEQTLLNLYSQHQNQQKVTLTQLLRFFKIILTTNYIPTVLKQNSQEIDSEKTQISFNTFGKIIFSHQSILQELERDKKRNNQCQEVHKQNQTHLREEKHHKPYKGCEKGIEHLVKQSQNIRSIPLLRQEDEIVETARFQNNENHHAYRQENEIERMHRKKSMILRRVKAINEQIELSINQSAKIDISEQKKLNIKEQVNSNANQEKKHSPITIHPSRGFLLSSRDHQIQKSKTIQSPSPAQHHNLQSIDQNTAFSLKNQNSCIQIEDISQILQTADNDKLLLTQFQARYNTKQQSTFTDPFHDSSLTDQDLIFRNSIPRPYSSNYNTSESFDQCRLQALNLNSSQLFLESVILSNLYHTNFNVSFSEQPLHDNQLEIPHQLQYWTNKQNYSKIQDVVQEIQNIIHSMKNLFSIQQDSPNNHPLLFKNVIRLQDLTQIEDFLSQFIDYKVFRKDIESNKISKDINQQKINKKNGNENYYYKKREDFDGELKNDNIDSQELRKDNIYKVLRKGDRSTLSCEYFNAVKLTEGNLTSFQTRKAAVEIVRSGLIEKYLSYFDAIRIYQAPSLIEHIEMLIGNSWNLKILNLSDNQLSGLGGLMKVIGNNMNCLQFLNLSNNKITSLESFFLLLQDHQGDCSFSELTQLHAKNNRIARLSYKGITQRQSQQHQSHSNSYQFPKLQLLDLRSNLIDSSEILSIKRLVMESPRLSVMSIKQNPIIKTKQKTHLQKFLNSKSIFEYDSLQMMSAYIKYKQITFTHSNQGCCSIIDIQPNETQRQLSLQQVKTQILQISHQQIVIY